MKTDGKNKPNEIVDKVVQADNTSQKDLALNPPLITHQLSGAKIHQRPKDGYINATDMCKAAGKLWSNYAQNARTKAFLGELSSVLGIPRTELIQTIQGGEPYSQGTWIHPDIAVNLGQWLSPKFAVWVSKWINEWLRGNVSGFMPPHVQRYIMNRAKIPSTHFSMLNEIYLEILAPLDDAKIRIPPTLMPDISTGKMFSTFLRNRGLEVGDYPTYEHEFPDGRIVFPRLYPIGRLGEFRIWLHNEWIPNQAIRYFRDRLPTAVPHIKQMLPNPEGKENDKD